MSLHAPIPAGSTGTTARHAAGVLPTDAWIGRLCWHFVDLREEPVRFRVPGARRVPLSSLTSDAVLLLAGEPSLVLLCDDGRASAGAAAVLQALGGDVTWVVGGVQAWHAADLPLLPGGDLCRRLREEVAGALSAGDLELELEPVLRLPSLEPVASTGAPVWHHDRRGRLSGAGVQRLADLTGLHDELASWRLAGLLRAAAEEEDRTVHLDLGEGLLDELGWGRRLPERLRWFGVDPAQVVLGLDAARLPDPRFGDVAQVREEAGVHVVATGVLRPADVAWCASGLDGVELHPAVVARVAESHGALATARAVAELAFERGWTAMAAGVERQPELERLAVLGYEQVRGGTPDG